jgi:hypothetical protein
VLRNMPWREVIFTDAGVVYPATWDMSYRDIVFTADGLPSFDSVRHSRAIAHARCISEEERVLLDLAGEVYPATSDMQKDKRDASSALNKHNFHLPSFADFDDDGDSTSEASSLAATYDIFSSRDAAPATSVRRTDERAETSPCSILRTEREQGPLLRRSCPACSERQPRNGCSSPVAILKRTSKISCSCECEDDSSFFSGDDTLTPSACSGDDLEAPEFPETEAHTVGQPF